MLTVTRSLTLCHAYCHSVPLEQQASKQAGSALAHYHSSSATLTEPLALLATQIISLALLALNNNVSQSTCRLEEHAEPTPPPQKGPFLKQQPCSSRTNYWHLVTGSTESLGVALVGHYYYYYYSLSLSRRGHLWPLLTQPLLVALGRWHSSVAGWH